MPSEECLCAERSGTRDTPYENPFLPAVRARCRRLEYDPSTDLIADTHTESLTLINVIECSTHTAQVPAIERRIDTRYKQ